MKTRALFTLFIFLYVITSCDNKEAEPEETLNLSEETFNVNEVLKDYIAAYDVTANYYYINENPQNGVYDTSEVHSKSYTIEIDTIPMEELKQLFYHPDGLDTFVMKIKGLYYSETSLLHFEKEMQDTIKIKSFYESYGSPLSGTIVVKDDSIFFDYGRFSSGSLKLFNKIKYTGKGSKK
ncbi:hypothetical protein BXY85_2846 [Roseivirga pacifica]|uniref:Uncharacterized protein n=1 Tax=Roseivirga pacifica TaxID=1267423 RepID=A0A1I0R0I8_9BACT|nr:hypothetical protein [Roseivirga pacifica]RKQ42240.1 hypothetical protein BXY85_2846 [Roseivirga pacifica]SEW33572.1 hypothetical protein SAMN05216290_3026 [Roseivirga pacifica]